MNLDRQNNKNWVSKAETTLDNQNGKKFILGKERFIKCLQARTKITKVNFSKARIT